ncbi:MAG: M56 family metallopeptidase [Acidobacteriota bacterium]
MGPFLDSVAHLIDSSFWLMILVESFLKGAVLLLVSGVILRLLKPLSASTRHLVSSIALCSLILLPLGMAVLPSWNLPLISERWAPGWVRHGSHLRGRLLGDRTTLEPEEVLEPTERGRELSASGLPSKMPNPQMAKSRPGKTRLPDSFHRPPAGADGTTVLDSWPLLLLLIWASGTLFVVARVFIAMACIRWAVRRASADLDGAWESLASQAASRLGLRRKVRLLVSPRIEVALSVGFWRPVVLVPRIAHTWSWSRRRSILLHEFAHVKRRDNLTNIIAQVACALHWLNPLAWWTARQLKGDRELACDDQVLAAGTRPSDYAGHLLEVARAVSSRRLWGQLEVSQSSALKRRVVAVLNPRLERRGLALPGVLCSLLVSVGLLLPLAALEPWSEEDASGLQSEAGAIVPLAARSKRDGRQSPFSGHRGGPGLLHLKSSQALPPANRAAGQGLPGAQRARPTRLLKGRLVVVASSFERGDSFASGAGPSPVRASREWTPARLGDLESRIPADSDPTRFLTGSRGLPVRSAATRPPGPRRPGPAEAADSNPPEKVPAPVKEAALRAEVVRVDLGTLGGGESEAVDINDSGDVVGASRNASGIVHPFLWTRDGGMIDLGNPVASHTRAVQVNRQGFVLCETFNTFRFRAFVWTPENGMVDIGGLDPDLPLTFPKAMNDQGQVVGGSRGPRGLLQAFIWSPEEGIAQLGAPGWSEALAINDAGQVVGYSDDKAFLWSAQEGLRFLAPPGATFSVAADVNNLGQVVGYAKFDGGFEHAFLWEPETGALDLGTLGDEFPISLAVEINDLSQVVGRSLSLPDEVSAEQVRAFQWTPENGMKDIGVSSSESRLAINAMGQILGTYGHDSSSTGTSVPFLWTENGSVELTDKDDFDSSLSEVVAVNNRGQIVGSTLTLSNKRHASLWEVRLTPGTDDPGPPSQQ